MREDRRCHGHTKEGGGNEERERYAEKKNMTASLSIVYVSSIVVSRCGLWPIWSGTYDERNFFRRPITTAYAEEEKNTERNEEGRKILKCWGKNKFQKKGEESKEEGGTLLSVQRFHFPQME